MWDRNQKINYQISTNRESHNSCRHISIISPPPIWPLKIIHEPNEHQANRTSTGQRLSTLRYTKNLHVSIIQNGFVQQFLCHFLLSGYRVLAPNTKYIIIIIISRLAILSLKYPLIFVPIQRCLNSLPILDHLEIFLKYRFYVICCTVFKPITLNALLLLKNLIWTEMCTVFCLLNHPQRQIDEKTILCSRGNYAG